jgi:hypothetical protein
MSTKKRTTKKQTIKEQNISILMDVDFEGSNAIRNLARPFNVMATMVDSEGPGGDNPVFRFIGTKANLRSFLKKHFNPGLSGTALEEELDFYMEDAEPV